MRLNQFRSYHDATPCQFRSIPSNMAFPGHLYVGRLRKILRLPIRRILATALSAWSSIRRTSASVKRFSTQDHHHCLLCLGRVIINVFITNKITVGHQIVTRVLVLRPLSNAFLLTIIIIVFFVFMIIISQSPELTIH